MRKTTTLGLVALLVLLAARADGVGSGEAPRALAPNPDAPAETAQFAFLVGEWECRTKNLRPDGSVIEGRARWKGYYILGGWAIQDEWTRETSGQSFYGTNVRSFDSEKKKWNNMWLPSGSLKWIYFESEQVGDTMVMIGGEGADAIGPYVDRNTFHDITHDHFDWTKDRSYDGGKTWIEGVARISADRAR